MPAKIVSKKEIPLFLGSVKAGFPSPTSGEIDKILDLNDFLIDHPAATYFVRARGESMIGVGIFDNDILVVDKSLEPKNGSIIIAAIDDEFTVKQLEKKGKEVLLLPANPNYDPIEINKETNFEIWGVVKHVIHSLG